ncbi:MAG: OmpA/MotB family protein [Chitinophagaceae bacterium]
MQKLMLSLLFISLLLMDFSCVPAKKFQQEKALSQQYHTRSIESQQQANLLQTELDTLQSQADQLQSQLTDLRQDTTQYGHQFRKSQDLNSTLNELYTRIIQQNRNLLVHSTTAQNTLSNELSLKEQLLSSKEAKVQQLEEILSRKDSAVNSLKTRISQALLGFDQNDLSVTNRNGKIYVSLAEKLLFRSGSTAVDPKGVEALQKLAEVLQKDSSINIMIEGYTDNVPLKPTASIRDNWDLSVLRATSIVRILIADQVAPTQITAAGHGEFMPVASNDSAQGRALNRRTEIILSPNLDELFQLLKTP